MGATKNSNPAFSFVHKTLNYWPKFMHCTISTLYLQLRSQELLLCIITCTVLRVICLLGGLPKPLVITKCRQLYEPPLKALELQQVNRDEKQKIIYVYTNWKSSEVPHSLILPITEISSRQVRSACLERNNLNCRRTDVY